MATGSRNKRATPEQAFIKVMLRFKESGLSLRRSVMTDGNEAESLEELDERIKKLLGILTNVNRKDNRMIYFIMYDIEYNKVRHQVAKYLIRKGCTRVQKSIFIANSDRMKYNELVQTLREVQEMYDNNDSIFFVPVSTDEIKSMKVIGKNVDFDLVTGSKNTLFF